MAYELLNLEWTDKQVGNAALPSNLPYGKPMILPLATFLSVAAHNGKKPVSSNPGTIYVPPS